MRRVLTLFIMLMLSGVLAFAQNRVVTGTVTDDKGAPIEGASVRVKGSRTGVAADANGNFRISVPSGATLVFSGVGITTSEIPVGNQSTINATLVRSGTELSAVTVITTAFGIKRQPRELGYSTATVSGADLNQTKVVNPVTGLTGKVSGLQIQTADNSVNPQVRVTLRGNRSITGNNQALAIVDGVAVDNSFLARLNPNDIESLTVLKGASASALYGSNASNGVLVVTTKRGSKGVPKINFSSTVQTERISYMPKLQNRFGSYGGEDRSDPFGVSFPEDPIHLYFPYENQSYGPEYNGRLVPLGGPIKVFRSDGSSYDSTRMVTYSAIPNRTRDFFDKGITLQNNVNLSTGDATSSLYLSYQNVSITGTIPKDKAQRNTFRINAMKEYGRFRADFNVSYSLEKNDVIGNTTNYDKGYYPLYWEVLNQPQHVDLKYFKDWKNNIFSTPDGYYNAYYGNPYWYIDNDRSLVRNNTFTGNVRLSFKLTNWLDLSYNAAYTRNDQNYKETIAGVKYSAYTLSDPWGASSSYSRNGNLEPQVYDQLTYNNRISGDALLTANKSFGDFSTKLILGNHLSKRQYSYIYTSTTSLIVPGLYNIAYRLGEPTVDQQYASEGLVSVFGDLTLGYKNYLFVHGTARNDWTSKLAPQNRSIFYPGVDVSFVFTDAIPGFKNNSVLSYGKVRAAWTKVGQVSIGPYRLNNTVSQSNGFPYGSQAGFTLSTSFLNPDLKAEFTTEKEVGIELGFLKNRINLQAAYFDANTTNQTLPSTISSASGFFRSTVNLGSMSNKGIELDLKLTPLLNLGPVKWNFGANFAYIKNRVGTDIGGEISLGNNVYATPGKPYPNLKVSDFTRDSASGKIIVSATTGFPTNSSTLISYGTTVAPYKVGLTTSFNYKGLTLSAVADAQFGGVIFNQIGSNLMFGGIEWYSTQANRQPFVFPNSVYLQNGKYVDNTNVLTNTASQSGEWRLWANTMRTISSQFVNSSDYWKIREIALTWNIPKTLTRGVKVVQSASLTLSGRNLFMFRAKDNVWTDPEFSNNIGVGGLTGFSTGNITNAVGTTNYYQTPPTRIFGATLNVTF
ncbi:MAG: SusC/RagA family TonB-linked outer membrane protein [Bacteroidota bacterium]|nr:SusC/RagA family TonB-linked outer membrane protein [Bacteroidota bacterium]